MTQILMKVQVFCYVTTSLCEYTSNYRITSTGLSIETLNLAPRTI